MEFEIVHEFHHPCPVVSVVWSPVSSSDAVPKICCFATAGSDGKIRIFNSDLASVHDVLVCLLHCFLPGHRCDDSLKCFLMDRS